MQSPLPQHEDLRLEALREYEILDTDAETTLDELTQLAATICDVPTALISLVDCDRQWFKSHIGIDAQETPRDWSFCSYAILNPESLFIIEDATKDERFAGNPMVINDPKIRFYAGAPLVTPDGYALGSLCVIDYKNGTLSEEQKASLQRLAKQVMSQFELRRSLKKNEVLSNRYQQILSNSADGICLYDFEGKLLSVNQKFCELTGRSEEELLKMRMPDLHAPEDLLLRPIPYEALRNGQALTYERQLQRPDGTIFTVEKSGKMIDENTIQAIIRDVSGRKQIEQELRAAHDAALESARLKSAFLTNVSHEIRTPLNGLLGMTELLLRTPLDRVQREYVEVIHKGGESLLRIINDLLDIAKMESGTARFDEIAFDVRDVVESSLEILAEKAYRKNIEVATYFEPNVPKDVWGDPGRLRQVLMNLIGNAIKFTSDGGVLIDVKLDEHSDRRIKLNFTVSDTGIGIDEGDLRSLFQPFVQVDDSMTREYGGTGLGLVISKEIVEMMGGEVFVESIVGVGSKFSFTACFEEVEADDSRKHLGLSDEESADLLRGRRVMIIDESPLIRETIARYCRDWEMVPTEVTSGNDAIMEALESSAEGNPFDFVIIDMHLPDWEGFALAERLMMDDISGNGKIVVITAHGKRGEAEIAEKKGVSCYFTKPVCGKQIFECLTAAAKARVNPDKTQTPALITRHSLRETQLKSGHLPFLNANDYKILLVEDNEVNRRLVLKQLEQVGLTADVASDGMEAIDKIQRGNYGLVLMDCQMPKLDGYQATEEIRRLEKQRLESGEPITPLVIIALTAHSFPGEREKCLNAGMDEYLPKPIRLHKLISLVQHWYPRQDVEFTTNREYILEAEQQSRHKKNFTASDDRPLDAIKDEEFATEISDLYRTETKKHLDQLTEALSEGNAEEITRIAHALRGNALSLDEDATARVAEQIERAGDQRALDEVRELLVEIKRLQLT